jgi:hypothetical protein
VAAVAFSAALGRCSFLAAILGMWYLALEPTVRRRWPWRLVAWGRLLDGRLGDPLVGRDLLAAGQFLPSSRFSGSCCSWSGVAADDCR